MIQNVHIINVQIMVEILVAGHMLAWYLPHRENYFPRLLGGGLLFLLLAWLYPVTEYAQSHIILWGTMMYAALFALLVLHLFLCYDEPMISILVCAIAGYTVHHLDSEINGLLSDVLQLLQIPMPSWAVSAASVVPVFWLCYRELSPGIRREGHIHIDSRKVPFLSAAALLVDIECGLAAMYLSSINQVIAYEILVKLLNCLACIFILYVQSGLMSNHRLQTELTILSQMLKEEKRQFENSQSNIAIINQKCHDLRHQIRTIRHQTGEVDRAALKEIEQTIDIFDTSTETGNPALDVILTEKKLLCESKGIVFTCIADGSGLEGVSSTDIYALFGNILDNAIEAVCRLEQPEDRSFSLSVRRIGEMTVIHQENPYSGEIVLKDGIPQTHKQDTIYHGFGVRSIRMIAEKYSGHVALSTANQVFALTVTLLS